KDAAVPVTLAPDSRMTFPFTATADFTRAPLRRMTSPSRAMAFSRDSPASTTTVFPRPSRSCGPTVTTHSSARAGAETTTARNTRSGRSTNHLQGGDAPKTMVPRLDFGLLRGRNVVPATWCQTPRRGRRTAPCESTDPGFGEEWRFRSNFSDLRPDRTRG